MGNEKWDDLDVVFLLGAGASKPLGLPLSNEMMEGYLDRIRNESEKGNFFRRILHTYNVENHYRSGISDSKSLNIKSNLSELDIEYVFSLLESFKENFREKRNFLFSFEIMRAYIFASLNSPYSYIGKDLNKDVNAKMNAMRSIEDEGRRLSIFEQNIYDIDIDLKRYIHSKLSKTLYNNQPSKYYKRLFDCFLNKKKLVIFTTNYDLSLENAFEGEGGELPPADVYIGFESKSNRTVFVDDKNKIMETLKKPVENKIINIFKIHGSVDWQKYNGKIVRGASVGISNPHDLFLIYPGIKNWENSGIDEVDSRIFRILHDVFKEVLGHSRALISVGFAFRDKYIYQIIKEALLNNDNLKIYSINPSFPPDSYFSLLENEFPDRVFHEKIRIVFDFNKPEKPDFYLLDVKSGQKFNGLCDLIQLKT